MTNFSKPGGRGTSWPESISPIEEGEEEIHQKYIVRSTWVTTNNHCNLKSVHVQYPETTNDMHYLHVLILEQLVISLSEFRPSPKLYTGAQQRVIWATRELRCSHPHAPQYLSAGCCYPIRSKLWAISTRITFHILDMKGFLYKKRRLAITDKRTTPVKWMHMFPSLRPPENFPKILKWIHM